jgi:hypothetical protein
MPLEKETRYLRIEGGDVRLRKTSRSFLDGKGMQRQDRKLSRGMHTRRYRPNSGWRDSCGEQDKPLDGASEKLLKDDDDGLTAEPVVLFEFEDLDEEITDRGGEVWNVETTPDVVDQHHRSEGGSGGEGGQKAMTHMTRLSLLPKAWARAEDPTAPEDERLTLRQQ